MLRFLSIALFISLPFLLLGQFPPAADQAGTTALAKDDPIFINWATGVDIIRGEQNIADDSLNFASVGEPEFALGTPDNQIVSLGDSGVAILIFEKPIRDGNGFDFAVFENGFLTQGGYFLELAFVEVSSDGVFFVRFPAISLTDTTQQLATFDLIQPEKINNLAGKYVSGFGTPFDLSELKDIPNLDISNITHVKIIDVIGSLTDTIATLDAFGNKINDPFPTAFPSGGFDLDAVGVIHENTSTSITNNKVEKQFTIYPNPLIRNESLTIEFNSPLSKILALQLYTLSGNLIKTIFVKDKIIQLPYTYFSKGIHYLKITTDEQSIVKKIMVLE